MGAGRGDLFVRPGPDPHHSCQHQVAHLDTFLRYFCPVCPLLCFLPEVTALSVFSQVALCHPHSGPVKTQHPVGNHGETAAGSTSSGGKNLF